MEDNFENMEIGPESEKVLITPGTYESEFIGVNIKMEDTPWGNKKAAKLRFKITSGTFIGQHVVFKAYYFNLPGTTTHVIGSKTRLAEAIRSITGGKTALTKENIGTRTFIKVKNHVSKKTGETFPLVDSVIEMPSTYNPTPAAQAPKTQMATVANQTSQPVQPTQQPTQTDTNVLDELTDISDFDL